jgi:hypothetical protein
MAQTTQQLDRTYLFEAFDRDGKLKWTKEFHNLTTMGGLNLMVDTFFTGSAYTAALTVGLTGGSPSFAIGDTLTTHPGWTENTSYTGGRKTLTMAAASGGVSSNTASKATFVFTASATIGGAFIVSGGSVLFGGGALAGGNRTFTSGETLQITITNTIS